MKNEKENVKNMNVSQACTSSVHRYRNQPIYGNKNKVGRCEYAQTSKSLESYLRGTCVGKCSCHGSCGGDHFTVLFVCLLFFCFVFGFLWLCLLFV